MTSHLTPENATLADRHFAHRQALFDDPARFHPLLAKCQVDVLVVADGFLYFSDEDFGLSDFVGILRANFSPFARLNVQLAHRGNPGATRLAGGTPNFVFTAEALDGIDVLCLFAAQTAGAPGLGASELAAIQGFMDAGGGVFATGDHEDLGVAMCGEIPRVRSMRKWYWPEAAANAAGQPVAPDGGTASRHDTNREGHDAGFSFDDQSDDVPQEIAPKMYRSGIFHRRPHPLLCGPNGTIRVLPDHPHEGECIAPADLATHTLAEFPELAGHREAPEVIAISTMVPGAETLGKPPVPGGQFGAVSAYDGHRSGVGRVSTDATWHHFININLTGTASRPVGHPKSLGFLATPAGQAHLEDIKAYFRNIAVWLAPRPVQRCIAFRKLLSRLVISSELSEAVATLRLSRATLTELVRTGGVVRSVLSVNTEICEELAIDVLRPPFLDAIWRVLIPLPLPQPDPPPFDLEATLLDASLGGMALRLRDALEENGEAADDPALEAALMREAERGAAQGGERAIEAMARELDATRARLDEALKAFPTTAR